MCKLVIKEYRNKSENSIHNMLIKEFNKTNENKWTSGVNEIKAKST